MKKINLDMDLSPEMLKAGIVIAAFFLAWVANNYLKEATVRMGSQTIYGEQAPPSLAITKANAQKLVALSIVQSSTTNEQSASVTNDQLIEDAFSLPQPVVDIKDSEVKKVINPIMDLFSRYRPHVSGITNNGAFINGHFYAIQEPMVSMSVIGGNGQSLIPKITKVFANGVGIELDGSPITLTFKSY